MSCPVLSRIWQGFYEPPFYKRLKFTELKQVIDELATERSDRERLETILENTYEGVVVVDEQARNTMISQAYTEFLGIRREEVIGKDVREVIENTRMHIVVRKRDSLKNESGARSQKQISICINSRSLCPLWLIKAESWRLIVDSCFQPPSSLFIFLMYVSVSSYGGTPPYCSTAPGPALYAARARLISPLNLSIIDLR